MKIKSISVLISFLLCSEAFAGFEVVCGSILNTKWYPTNTFMAVALWDPEEEIDWTKGNFSTIFFGPPNVTIANNPIYHAF